MDEERVIPEAKVRVELFDEGHAKIEGHVRTWAGMTDRDMQRMLAQVDVSRVEVTYKDGTSVAYEREGW